MSIGKKVCFFLKIKIYFFFQGLKTIFRYYYNIRFMCFDLCFSFVYLFLNPYRMSRKFLEKKLLEKIYDYGETPLGEIEKIVKKFDVRSSYKVLELGAGRGKISFWLYFFVKCHVTAIEQIPSFVKIANFFVKLFGIRKIKFFCMDFFDFEMDDFDVIYLYGTTLSDEKIKILINKLKKLPSYVKIITVSYSLKEYDDDFICTKNSDVFFPWGQTKIYLNVKRS